MFAFFSTHTHTYRPESHEGENHSQKKHTSTQESRDEPVLALKYSRIFIYSAFGLVLGYECFLEIERVFFLASFKF